MLNLVWSFILDFENSANPNQIIKDEIFSWRYFSHVMVHLEPDIIEHANNLIKYGFGKKDALHIACASKAKADFFITVDKGILKKANVVDDLRIVNPIIFINYLEEKNEN